MGTGGQEFQTITAGYRSNNGVAAGANCSNKRVLAGNFINAATNTLDGPRLHETGKRFADGAGIAKIRQIAGRERAIILLSSDTAQDVCRKLAVRCFHW